MGFKAQMPSLKTDQKLKPKQSVSLCVACDGMAPDQVFSFLDRLKNPSEIIIKIGLGNMFYFTDSDLKKIKSYGARLFVDAKLHDIPSQVERAVMYWSTRGADFITLHLSGGSEMLKTAQTSLIKNNSSTYLLGVSALTSLSKKNLKEMAVSLSASSWGLKLIACGYKSGLSHFVCAATDLEYFKKKLSRRKFDTMTWVTPGVICPGEVPHKDQKRSLDYKKAKKLGSGMLVMGRSIFRSPNPAALAEEIMENLK
jgi:orotidine-5'-phosphate decarboxylase